MARRFFYIAAGMFLVEFVADKVPYVDSVWDVIHTFIRIPAGALLAARAVGNVNPALELAALLARGARSRCGIRGVRGGGQHEQDGRPQPHRDQCGQHRPP